MNPSNALVRLMRGIGEDVRAYRGLQTLLDAQFDAALGHRTERLRELADQLLAEVETIDARRRERVELVQNLIGAGGSVSATFGLLPAAQRQAIESGWQTLETLALRCKQQNQRNCLLMTDQHDIMRRVLHGEGSLYAPA